MQVPSSNLGSISGILLRGNNMRAIGGETMLVTTSANSRDPLWIYPVVLGGLALVGILLRYLDHRYPSKRKYRGSIGNALMSVEASFLPGHEHILDAIEHEEADEDDQGEPPETGR